MQGVQDIRNLLVAAKEWNIFPVQDPYLSPSYIIGLASMINAGIYSNRILDKLNFSPSIQSYLSRCNFMNTISTWVISGHTWRSFNLTEITIINKDFHFWEITKMFANCLLIKMEVQDIKNKQNMTTAIDQTLLQSFSEIVNNILVHSHADFSKKTCMYMMQYYSTTRMVHIACVDGGIGIVESLKRSKHYNPEYDELKYLELALTQGITGNPMEWQGNWLYTCSKIMECVEWSLEILSWEVYYKQIWQKTNYEYNWCAFPGTLINFEVNIDKIIQNEPRWKAYLWDRYIESTDLPIYDGLRN